MGRAANKLDAWRAARELRNQQREGLPLRRRAPSPVVPGGYAAAHTPAPTRQTSTETRPVPKHVPRNTHRAGSIAYAFLYAYRRPE